MATVIDLEFPQPCRDKAGRQRRGGVSRGTEITLAGISGRKKVPVPSSPKWRLALKHRQAKPTRPAFITHRHLVGRPEDLFVCYSLATRMILQCNPCAAYIVTPRSIGLPRQAVLAPSLYGVMRVAQVVATLESKKSFAQSPGHKLLCTS